MNTTFERQDIGYLLTAYADGQLAPEGVMWVEEQLDRNADLRARLKEIRHLQAGLRTAFAGGAPEFVLDLPRREALLASAANPPRGRKLRFPGPLWIGLAASVMAIVYVGMQQMSGPMYFARQSEAELPPMKVTSIDPAPAVDFQVDQQQAQELAQTPAEAGEAQSYNYRKNDAEGIALRGQQRNRGVEDSLERSVDSLYAADKPTGGATFGGQAAEPELLAKGQRDAAPRQGGGEWKTATATVSPMRPAAPAAAAPPAPSMMPAPAGTSQARSDRGGRPATKESAGKPVATPSAPPAPKPDPVVQPQEFAKRSAQDGLDDSRQTKGKNAPQQAPPADGYQSRAYNGAVGPSVARKVEQSAAQNAAPAKPGVAGPQSGKDKAVEQVPVAVLELAEADVAAPLNQLDVPIEEKTTSEDEKTAEGAKGREEAVASSETISTGSFLALGAGGKSGAERRAIAKKEVAEQQASSPGQHMRQILAGELVEKKGAEVADGEKNVVAQRKLKQQAAKAGQAPAADGRNQMNFYDVATVARSMASFPGPDLDIPEPGAVGNRLLPPIEPDTRPEINELIETIQRVIAPESWQEEGVAIEDFNGQIVVTNTPEVQQQVAAFLADLHEQQKRYPNGAGASLVYLKQRVTGEYRDELSEVLDQIGDGVVVYRIAPALEPLMATQVQSKMHDEVVARGVLRQVRQAGLQMTIKEGVVGIDRASRPLDPADTQGFDLPTFKDLFGTSPMQVTAVDAIQTVAIDADTASYEYAKARVASGEPVDPTTIKPEHFINAMPMDYPPAQGTEAFMLYAEAAPSPFARAGTSWGPRTAVVSIGAVAKPAAADERKPLALTLAIDCSGSMAQAGGLDRIQRGLLAFVDQLRAEDRVSIVAFGDQARVILPATPGNDRAALVNALANLATGGATNAAEGLGLAYQLAAETAAVGVESRVLLATDGGTVAGADDLLRRVTAFKDRGITLVVVGTGQTYRAGPLQDLATKGDGQHFYVGSDEDAQALFTGKLLPDRLAVLAKDAKLQVTWNPQRVSHARLIGYDQRRLAAKDFRDNSVDAGELSQDTQVTALFEILLVDGGAGPLGTAAVRYKDMRRDQVRELACPLPGTILQSQPSERLRLLTCAAATAEWLQRGWWSNVHLITPQEIAAQLARCPQPIANELRAMVK